MNDELSELLPVTEQPVLTEQPSLTEEFNEQLPLSEQIRVLYEKCAHIGFTQKTFVTATEFSHKIFSYTQEHAIASFDARDHSLVIRFGYVHSGLQFIINDEVVSIVNTVGAEKKPYESNILDEYLQNLLKTLQR